MQPEQATTAPENAPQADSTPIKKQHGGKRPGAGRKPNLLKRMIGRLKPGTAADILAGIDVDGVIAEIMKKGSLSLKQRTIADLMDRAWGRPAQAVNVSGGLLHAHTGWRPIADWTDEELAWAEKLSKKLLPQNASQDGPQNQPQSSTVIEAEVVDTLRLASSTATVRDSVRVLRSL